MTAPRRWLRLDVTWSSSSWLVVLRPGGRLAWVELLAYVKGSGIGGRVKALPVDAAARRWGIPRQDVAAMLQAAQTPHGDEDVGALQLVGGDWVVTNWSTYQEVDMTAAERMRKHRALRRNGAKDEKANGARPPRNGVSRRNSRNVTRVPSRDRDVDVDVDVDSDRDNSGGTPARASSALPEGWTPNDQHRAAAQAGRIDVGRLATKFVGHYRANGAELVDWDAKFDEWIAGEPDFNGNGAHGRPEPEHTIARLPPVPWTEPHEPDTDPETRKAGLELVRAAIQAAKSPGNEPTITDPEVIARREAELERQRGIARRAAKT